MAKSKQTTVSRTTHLRALLSADGTIRSTTNFQSLLPAGADVDDRVAAVVQKWAQLDAPPGAKPVLEGLWVLNNGNAAFYTPPDTTGAKLLAQAMNKEFIALNLQPSDLDPAGPIKTVGDLMAAA